MTDAYRPNDQRAQPPGVEGEGLDPYPTYRDGPVPPHRATVTKPTDVGLPRSKRTFALPILIGLGVFAVVILLRLIWGGFDAATTTDEAGTPGDTADSPSASAPANDTPAEAPDTSESGEVGAQPGAIDVPGGATTDPPAPAEQ